MCRLFTAFQRPRLFADFCTCQRPTMTRSVDRLAVFLDRDGTIIEDVGYVSDPEQVNLCHGVGAALAKLSQHFMLVLVSNQSGIGRGIISGAQAASVHGRLVELLNGFGVQLDAVYYCPHVPTDRCMCRNPSPAMLARAGLDLRLNLAACWMIGDKISDIRAGQRATCRTVLFVPNPLAVKHEIVPNYVAASWEEVVNIVLAGSGFA